MTATATIDDLESDLLTGATAEQRVSAGAERLDTRAPGWVENIDLDLLDVGSCAACMVSQVTGVGYLEGLADLGLTYGSPLGFWPADADDRRALNAAWRELILARRLGAR